MKKRIVATVLAVIVALSVCQIAVFADEAVPISETTEAGVVTPTEKSDNYTYAQYLNDNAALADATVSLSKVGDAYSSKDADAENIGTYTDENGVAKDGVIKWTGEKGTVAYTFNVEQAGLYELMFTYCPIKGRGMPISVSVSLDENLPYASLKSVNFSRTWVDENPEGVHDSAGNVYSSEQIEKFLFKSEKAMDTTGQYIEPLKLALSEGEHTVAITVTAGEFYLAGVSLVAPEKVKTYAEIKAEYAANGYTNYQGSEIRIEGESAKYKSTSSLNPLIDNSNPSVYPSEAFKSIINYIGGTGWQSPNETLTWEIDVPEDGLYKIAFRYRQSEVISGNSYRNLKIDGVSPFSEASSISFYYGGNWQFKELAVENDEPALIYLTKGKHELSMSVTLSEFGDISREINDITYDIGNLYLKIRMITGDNIDSGRSYEFFSQIPNFNETLLLNIDKLQKICDRIIEVTGQDSGTYVSTVQNMIRVMRDMYDSPYTAQRYVSSYYDYYCSLCALVSDLAKLPLDIDQIILAAPESDYEFTMAGWWARTKHSFQRFIVSFMDEYRYSTENVDGKTSLTLWVTWGRDQTEILTSLVKDSFETEHPDINVNVQIVGASLIQAILSGNGPDMLIGQARNSPVNYGMRGALYDLTQFEDFDEVMKNFQESSEDPYRLGDAVYGLPDTQNFMVMYYRTDIFEQMGLQVPKTWDEFKNVSALLQRQNLQVGLPNAGVLHQYATYLLQNNSSLYTADGKKTNVSSGPAVEAFVFWTDFYVNLGFDVTFDFYNRFRSGTMPLGIAYYTQYTTFSQAAPEITGKWSIAKMPGVMQEDGTINYAQADTGTASVIPNISRNKEAAWEFLKWWSSENTQYRFSLMTEAVLGDVGRYATANIEAFKKLSWQSDHLEVLLDAWKDTKGLEEIPGGYYVERSIYQAFWNVVNLSENPKDMIVKWGKVADQEVERKRGEYNLD